MPPNRFLFSDNGHPCACPCVPAYVAKVREHFKDAYMEAHSWTNSEAE